MLKSKETRRVCLSNVDGLHMRSALILCEYARKFPCLVQVTCGDRQADAKSIWDLIFLAAECGSELLFEAQGPQSLQALDCLEKLVRQHFQVAAERECCREPNPS
jgi:phosphotransferase system HPr (HPr) family protein